MLKPIITLMTDFGSRDPYVAEMKAVILGIVPDVTIVDTSHEIEKFDIRMGAYVLASASPFFPTGTIHVAVVDPGVGTKRRPIIVHAGRSFFVGPDNGVLALAAKNQGIEHAYYITNRKFMLPKVSNVFHGRDIFAPVAAHLAGGTPAAEFGPEISRISTPSFAQVAQRKYVLIGEVMHIDGFGNIVTNLGEQEIAPAKAGPALSVKLKNTRLKLKLCKTYSEVPPHRPLAVIGSHGFFEIAMNQGNAAEHFRARVGDKVTLYLR